MESMNATLDYLLSEPSFTRRYKRSSDTQKQHLAHLHTSDQLRLLSQLLCIRTPEPPLPESVMADIDAILLQRRSSRILTDSRALGSPTPFRTVAGKAVEVGIWKGDITTINNATAIVNAANSAGLGCFQPWHQCIDHAIHRAAGPRLRQECSEVMESRGRPLEPGETITTSGYSLPARHVIHALGPELDGDSDPTEEESEQLARCYCSVLDNAEILPPDEIGQKVIVFCSVSTGLFAFPIERAATIAVDTVFNWLREHDNTTSITKIIFDTFSSEDQDIYRDVVAQRHQFADTSSSSLIFNQPSIENASVRRAQEWLKSTDAVIVSAGAGFSAADGLDFNSKALFASHYPGFLKYGFRTLYNTIGFNEWPTEQDRWSYYFTHLHHIRSWPRSSLYKTLIDYLNSFGSDAYVRTSNADNLFPRNGWQAEKLSTPQGSLMILQCTANCRPDSTIDAGPVIDNALPLMDPSSQTLTDLSKIPRCQFCGARMEICVRVDSSFNELPFKNGEMQWKSFLKRINEEKKNVVILELGVGESTAGVLRYPNENRVRNSGGAFKLIRVGLGVESAVPSDLENAGNAVSIEGDISLILESLLRS